MELLDVYDAAGKPTGRTIFRGTAPGEGEFLLVVHVCVFNSRGEMLLQQRQITKDRYPGCWDVSAGGFAKSGESSEAAVVRELREELGLAAEENELEFAVREPFSYVLDDFYILRCEPELSSLKLQSEELMGAKWAGEEETLAMRENGSLVDYDVTLLRRLFAAGR